LWIANGTDAGTGGRLVTVPFLPIVPAPKGADRGCDGTRAFRMAVRLGDRCVLSCCGGDVPISTAIDNTSRFPYLEPSGELLR